MKKKLIFTIMTVVSFQISAMEPLTDQELQHVEGQAGADLSLKLSLNHDVLTDAQLSSGVAPTFNCNPAKLEFCRLGISPNKRFVQATTNTTLYPSGFMPDDMSGIRLWVVLKGLQGTINIQKLGLDGATLSVNGLDKAVIKLSYAAEFPMQIRDYGFNSLSIERDGFISTQTSTNVLTEGAGTAFGYLNTGTYAEIAQRIDPIGGVLPANGPTGTTADRYDVGKETGFMGMRMNGNLALQGNIFMFSCDGSNPRC